MQTSDSKKTLLRVKYKGMLLEVHHPESSTYIVLCFRRFLGISWLKVKRTFSSVGEVQQFIFTWENEVL